MYNNKWKTKFNTKISYLNRTLSALEKREMNKIEEMRLSFSGS